MAEFFARNIVEVYFFYGLSFFCMGLAVMLESGRSSKLDFAQALRPLAGFGLVHGSHEWMEMILIIHQQAHGTPVPSFIGPLRVCLLATSFVFLLAFGARLIAGPTQRRLNWTMLLTVIAIWALGLLGVLVFQGDKTARIVAADVYTRYALAIPGAVLTTWGLVLQRRKFSQAGMHRFGPDVLLAALAFGLYGCIGQLFTSPSVLFPSTVVNAEAFVRWFGFPIQVFRAAMACMAAVFIIRSLRAFEEENRRQIEDLREAQLTEQRRLEALRAKLMHQTVKAQESERQRIARELHDELGQILTALGMGLRGLSESLVSQPQRSAQQARQLEGLVNTALDELKQLVTGLYPPQLDDFGLAAALRWYTAEVAQRAGIPITITSQGQEPTLTDDVKAVLYRIAQEAVTNALRHAQASQVAIQLTYQAGQATIRVDDDGRGFDVDAALNRRTDRPCWGLLGMIERSSLVGGACQIISQPGGGTMVEVSVPLGGGLNHAGS